MADELANRRDILMTAKGVRAIRDQLGDLVQGQREQNAERLGEIFMSIHDCAESADHPIRRVATHMFPEVYEDNGRLREFSAENWPWHMPERPQG